MAERVVKLKLEKPPLGPAIRLRRSDDGFSFSVECVDKNGVADFRTESLHNDFDDALKEAKYREKRYRLPIQNKTGVEFAPKAEAPTAKTPKPSGAKKALPAPVRHKSIQDLPSLASLFNLPRVDPRLDESFFELSIDRSQAVHRELRDSYLEIHNEIYGDARDHPVTYTQKTHDQIQGQLRGIIDQLQTVQGILYGFLEHAFERIEQLEHAPKGLNYRGVYHAGESYDPQDCVTWGGSMWVAKRQTSEKPGEAEGDDRPWQLACKKGRDGKDLRHAG